jgi:F-box protein, helicase, 18
MSKKLLIIVPENLDFIRISISSNLGSLINGNTKFKTIGLKQEYSKYGGIDFNKSFVYISDDPSLLKKKLKSKFKALKYFTNDNISGKNDLFSYLTYKMITEELNLKKMSSFEELFNMTFDTDLTLKVKKADIEQQSFIKKENENMAFKPTIEQQEILDNMSKYTSVKINAFAGTGKTSTLLMIADKLKNDKILYLAFNNSIAEEGKKKFPSNVKSVTTHSLAYQAIKKETTLDLNNLKQNYRAKELEDILNISYSDSFLVLKLLNKFMHSDKKLEKFINLSSESELIKVKSKEFWSLMDDGKIPITHDFYLKKFEMMLKNKQFFNLQDYDVIMLDEAQDTNVVTFSIFNNLLSRQKILVGDKHQQIYSFRNSINAMNNFEGEEFPLTETFRYTEDIAAQANVILKDLKNEDLYIKSNIKEKKIPKPEQAYLYRTNGAQIVKIKSFIENGIFFKTVRNPSNIFSLMLEIMYMLSNQKDKIKENFFLKSFDSLLEIQEYAESTDDVEIKSNLKTILKNKLSIKDVLKMIEISESFFKEKRESYITISSIHTAKGLEWDEVFIGEDLIDIEKKLEEKKIANKELWFSLMKEQTEKYQPIIDEINIKYIAVTRAKYKVKYLTKSK